MRLYHVAKWQMDNSKMITIVLVDPQSTVRQALRMRLGLEPDMQVLGETGDGESALDLVQKLRPRVVLMDIEMPRMDGITATEALHGLVPQSAVVISSLLSDNATRARARKAGAVAFVEKHEGEAPLIAAIRQAAATV